MVFYAAVLSSQIIVIKIAAVLSKFLKKENSRTVNILSCKWVTELSISIHSPELSCYNGFIDKARGFIKTTQYRVFSFRLLKKMVSLIGEFMNRVILTGLVGSEPNVINFQDGSKKVTASLATSERWTDKNTGERRERTEWHTIVFPPNNHETVLKYLTKGRRIEVEGKIRYRKHTNQEGKTSYYTEIDCSHFEFVGPAVPGSINPEQVHESTMPNTNVIDDLPY